MNGRPARDFQRPPSLYFSKGSGADTVQIPDVRGLRPGAAIAELRQAGFDAQVAPGSVDSAEFEPGTVAKTSPGPGSDAGPGTKVILYLSNGGGEAEPPDEDFPEDPLFPTFPGFPGG